MFYFHLYLNPIALCQAIKSISIAQVKCGSSWIGLGICVGSGGDGSVLVKTGGAALSKIDKNIHATQKRLEKYIKAKLIPRLMTQAPMRVMRKILCRTKI